MASYIEKLKTLDAYVPLAALAIFSLLLFGCAGGQAQKAGEPGGQLLGGVGDAEINTEQVEENEMLADESLLPQADVEDVGTGTGSEAEASGDDVGAAGGESGNGGGVFDSTAISESDVVVEEDNDADLIAENDVPDAE